MGLGLYFAEGEGPRFERPLRAEADIRKLIAPDPSTQLRYVLDAVAQIRKALADAVPLLGFSGSPFTLACYMIEGRGGSDFHETRRMLYERPNCCITCSTSTRAQWRTISMRRIEAGVQAVMIFDSWGGVLSGEAFHEFSLRYIERVCAQLRRETRRARKFRASSSPKAADCGWRALRNAVADALGLDWTVDIGQARARLGNRVALQGNLDPAVMLATPEVIRREAAKILAGYGHGSGHVFNLGHGISQFTPPENVAALVDAVHSESRQFH